MSENGRLWFCVPCLSPAMAIMDHDHMVSVNADSEEEAAAEACRQLEAEHSDLDPSYLDVMFVTEVDPEKIVAMNRHAAYHKSEQQCCGDGARFTDHGHSGMCPTRPNG